MKKSKVNLPSNSKEILDLVQKIQQKHLAEGAASPLSTLDWEVITPLIESVADAHERAEASRIEMHRAFQYRNLNLPVVKDVLRGFRDALTAKYMRHRRALAEWGFNVQDFSTTPPEAEDGSVP